MSSTQEMNTTHTNKPVCSTDSLNYDQMTLEEQKELIEITMKEWIEAFLGPNYKTMMRQCVH